VKLTASLKYSDYSLMVGMRYTSFGALLCVYNHSTYALKDISLNPIYSNGIPRQSIAKLVGYFSPTVCHFRYLTVCIAIAATLVATGGLPALDAPLTSEGQPQIQASQPISSPCVKMQRTLVDMSLCIQNPLDGSTVSGVVSVEAVLTGSIAEIRRAKLIFALNHEYVLTDYIAPYIFELPTDHFADGLSTISVIAELNNGTETNSASVNLNIDNSNSNISDQYSPFTPYIPPLPVAGQPLVLAATGDGASGETTAVTDMIASWNPAMFLYLGDVYEDGTYTEFYNWYGNGANYFSLFRPITNPTVGNHEYTGGKAPGYFEYWNNPPSYYSFDAAGWHFISLNSNVPKEMGVGRPEYNWLARDLALNLSQCTLAFMHAPRYSIGSEGGTPRLGPIWSLLANYQADLILTGHDHNYQRWEPIDSSGNPDPAGITQFVVGSGGHGIRPFISSDTRLVKGVDRVQDAIGALRLELYPNRATYEYINVNGVVLDSGEIECQRAISQFTYYVPNGSTANMRDCPNTNCNRVTTLSSGTELTVLNQTTGQVVNGSAIWFEVSVGNLHGYIHNSVLIRTQKQQ
jgi:hypothetical protein